jgi:hypothetical protein
MVSSILSRSFQRFIGGILRTVVEKWIDGAAIALAALYQLIIGRPANFWETITPLVWIVCFILAVHVVIAVIQVWREIGNLPKGEIVESLIFLPNNEKSKEFVPSSAPPFYQSKLLTIAATSLGLLFLPPYLIQHKAAQTRESTSPSQTQKPPSIQPTHTLLVRYTDSILPIRIAPRDTAYILQLRPDIFQWVEEVPNETQTPFSWPSDIRLPKKNELPNDVIYICELTNNEDKTFQAISIDFEVSFHELEPLPIIVTKNKDGTIGRTPSNPGLNHIAVIVFTPDHSEEVRDGAMVKQLKHSISLPEIHPGSTAKVYLINQSNYISKFTFPNKATAVIAGNAERVPIALIRPNVNVMDSVPWYGLGPASYHWK